RGALTKPATAIEDQTCESPSEQHEGGGIGTRVNTRLTPMALYVQNESGPPGRKQPGNSCVSPSNCQTPWAFDLNVCAVREKNPSPGCDAGSRKDSPLDGHWMPRSNVRVLSE